MHLGDVFVDGFGTLLVVVLSMLAARHGIHGPCHGKWDTIWWYEGKSYSNGWFRGTPIYGNSHLWEPPFGNRRVFSQKSPVFLGRSCQANMEIDRAERGCDSPPWQWKITHWIDVPIEVFMNRWHFPLQYLIVEELSNNEWFSVSHFFSSASFELRVSFHHVVNATWLYIADLVQPNWPPEFWVLWGGRGELVTEGVRPTKVVFPYSQQHLYQFLKIVMYGVSLFVCLSQPTHPYHSTSFPNRHRKWKNVISLLGMDNLEFRVFVL